VDLFGLACDKLQLLLASFEPWPMNIAITTITTDTIDFCYMLYELTAAYESCDLSNVVGLSAF